MDTIVIETTPTVKSQAENEAAFGRIQILATQRMAEFEQDYGFPTVLSYEEVLAVLMEVYTGHGYDFTGMTPADDFDQWVAEMEAEFGDMSDAQIAQRTGIQMF